MWLNDRVNLVRSFLYMLIAKIKNKNKKGKNVIISFLSRRKTNVYVEEPGPSKLGPKNKIYSKARARIGE